MLVASLPPPAIDVLTNVRDQVAAMGAAATAERPSRRAGGRGSVRATSILQRLLVVTFIRHSLTTRCEASDLGVTMEGVR